MSITNIIEWCNSNSGFIQSILAALTVIISMIAIFVSIMTARIPYKKKILVTSGAYINLNPFKEDGLHVTCINCGNRPIHIRKIGLFIKPNNTIINIKTIEKSQIKLNPGDETAQYFNTKDLKQLSEFNHSKKLYAYVEDFEGTVKRKCIGKVREYL